MLATHLCMYSCCQDSCQVVLLTGTECSACYAQCLTIFELCKLSAHLAGDATREEVVRTGNKPGGSCGLL